jgi:ketosteroid isomerase-like protein
MKAPGKGRPATRWVLVVGLQLLSVLSVQSCKKDQTESAKREAQPPQQRAVFGSTPESVRSEIPPQTPKMAAKPTAEASRSRERAPTTKPFDSKSRATSAEPQWPLVTDMGERMVGDDRGAVASNRASPEPARERFLHYEPPGSTVSDTGELTPEPQVSGSMMPIENLIRRWTDTLLARDLDSHMSLYAPTLNRFNGATNIPRETVRAFKQKLLARLVAVRRFEIYNLRLRSSGNGFVTAEFRIESDAVDSGIAGWYQLVLRTIGGQWKIHGEEKVQPLSRVAPRN